MFSYHCGIMLEINIKSYFKITHIFSGFPSGSAGKESTCNVRDMGSIPGLGRSPGEGKGYPLQYSGLDNSMDCIVHAVAKSRTQLSDFHFTSLQILKCIQKKIQQLMNWWTHHSRNKHFVHVFPFFPHIALYLILMILYPAFLQLSVEK